MRVETLIGAMATAIQPSIDVRTAPVQASIDTVAALVEVPGGPIPSSKLSTICGPIKAPVDAVTAPIELPLRAITAPIEPFLDTIAAPVGPICSSLVGPGLVKSQGQQQAHHYYSLFHNMSP